MRGILELGKFFGREPLGMNPFEECLSELPVLDLGECFMKRGIGWVRVVDKESENFACFFHVILLGEKCQCVHNQTGLYDIIPADKTRLRSCAVLARVKPEISMSEPTVRGRTYTPFRVRFLSFP